MSKMFEALKKFNSEAVDSGRDGLGIDLSMPVTGNIPEPQSAPAQSISKPEEDGSGIETANGIRTLPMRIEPHSAVISWTGPASQAGEHYRILRTRLIQHPKRPRIVVISSAGAGDGKTVTAINLAGMLSLRDNANVLLIDADFRRSKVASTLGLPNELGLAKTLDGSCTLQEAIIRVEQYPNLYVLPVGVCDSNPAELLDSERWKSVCSTVRERFSLVIIDAPPIAAVADYELIQASCDGILVVVRPNHTDRTLCNKAFELIPEKKRLGVVLNCAYEWFLWKTHESYYYSQ